MRLLLKIALLTGQRSSTVAGARLDELELDTANPRWRIDSSRMKNKDTDHVLPLTPAAVALFKRAIALNNEGAQFVFPSEGNGEHFDVHSVSRAMNRLCTRIGINPKKSEGKPGPRDKSKNLRVHDFRKALNTWLAERGISYDVRARIMHHSPPDVTSRNYDFSMLDGPMRQALQDWADHVGAVACADKSEASKVVAIRG